GGGQGGYPREQRGRHHARPCARCDAGGMEAGPPGQPPCRVPALPGRRPGDAAAAARKDHQYRVADELRGWHPGEPLHGQQGRGRTADQGARERVGAARHQRQRDRPRLHRHRPHPPAAGRHDPQPGHPRPHPGRAVGAAGRPRRSGRVSRLGRIRLHPRPSPGRRRRMAGPLDPSTRWEAARTWLVRAGPAEIVDWAILLAVLALGAAAALTGLTFLPAAGFVEHRARLVAFEQGALVIGTVALLRWVAGGRALPAPLLWGFAAAAAICLGSLATTTDLYSTRDEIFFRLSIMALVLAAAVSLTDRAKIRVALG